MQYSPISPMKALFWSAVINGVVAVPLMVVIILLASRKSVMGAFTSSRPIVILGWIGAAVMGVAAVLNVHPRLGGLGRPVHDRPLRVHASVRASGGTTSRTVARASHSCRALGR